MTTDPTPAVAARAAGRTPHAKARRLRTGRRVHQLPGARVFAVEGDHGTYIVVIHDGLAHCSCPAARECSHVLACREAVS